MTFAEGQTIDPWVLPSASGGNGEVTYELVGELPEGLSYDRRRGRFRVRYRRMRRILLRAMGMW